MSVLLSALTKSPTLTYHLSNLTAMKACSDDPSVDKENIQVKPQILHIEDHARITFVRSN